MNYEIRLKDRLHDLIDANQHLKKYIVTLEQDVEDRDETIEEIRGHIHVISNIADKRADMIRELVAENRKLKQQLQTPAITEDDIAQVQMETVDHIIYLIQEAYKKETGACSF